MDNININNNFIKCGFGRQALYCSPDGTKTKMNIIGNMFTNSGSAVHAPLVKIDNPDGGRLFISNNLFNSNHTTSSAYRLLYIDINEKSFVFSNMFTTGGAAFSVPSIYVTSTSADCICSFNNLKNITNTSGSGKVVDVSGVHRQFLKD